MNDSDAQSVEALSVKRWIEQFVVESNLCPFARRELELGRVRVVATDAQAESTLKSALTNELARLDEDSTIETTVLVHPNVLGDFLEYNDFLEEVDNLLEDLDRTGIYQVASFHPEYQFAGTSVDDAENYTNRSPYQMLHILREVSVERAIDSHTGVASIPARNIELMNQLGAALLSAKLAEYRQ